MEHFLSHLLPYDPEIKKQSRLKSGLNEFLMLLVAAEESMESFSRGELSKFDPLVGENSCQIRAVKIALIASKISFNIPELLQQISFSKKFIEQLLNAIEEHSLQDNSLKYFLDHQGVDIRLNCDAIFLVKAYILSKVKVSTDDPADLNLWKSEKTVSKKIKEFSELVGRDFADDLVRILREKLSKSSASFVHQISKCPLLEEKSIEAIIRDFSSSYKGLHSTPFYWMTKVIMHQALMSKIPIVVFVEQLAQDLELQVLEETVLFFHPTESGYEVVSRDFVEMDQPVIVFNAISCRNASDFPDKETWEKELTEHNLVDLVLACNAAHRQCPDLSVEELIRDIQDESYKYHLEKSQEWGCHLEAPFRFILRHIYCDNMKNL